MANTYLTDLRVGSNIAALGPTLFGTCNTYSREANKEVTLPAFDQVEPGIHITVRFLNGCKQTSGATLKVGAESAIPVSGPCICAANEALTFVYEQPGATIATGYWKVVGHYIFPSDETPTAIGTATAGTSDNYARADHTHNVDPSLITEIVEPVLGNVIYRPGNATEDNVAIFGESGESLKDSGCTIKTSVPRNAVFTDTKYEDKSTIQAVVDIAAGSNLSVASISSGRLYILNGLQLTKTDVSTGIKEVT